MRAGGAGRPGIISQPCHSTHGTGQSRVPPPPTLASQPEEADPVAVLRLSFRPWGVAVTPADSLFAQSFEVWGERLWRNISYSCVNYYYFYHYYRGERSPVNSLGKMAMKTNWHHRGLVPRRASTGKASTQPPNPPRPTPAKLVPQAGRPPLCPPPPPMHVHLCACSHMRTYTCGPRAVLQRREGR